MFELLYILQNWSFSQNCVIMQVFHWLYDRMQQEVNCAKSHQYIISESLIRMYELLKSLISVSNAQAVAIWICLNFWEVICVKPPV